MPDEKLIQEDQEPKSSVLSLVEDYAPDGDTFDIYLSKGEKLTFKNVQDTMEIKQMHANALAFAETCKKQGGHTHFAPFKGFDTTTLQRIAVLAYLCKNDDFGKKPAKKQEAYATIARKAGYLFREIHTKVDSKCLNYEWNSFGGQVEAAKKDSSPEA